jgi:dihydrolipoamide dehydrogenase
MPAPYDVVVIGSGPGGYVAAIRAADLGLKVLCVEKEKLGGVCLNWGCIPSKALLKTAEYAHTVRHLGDYGLKVGEIEVDYGRIIQRSREVAKKSEKGVQYLFKTHKVEHRFATARITAAAKEGAPGKVELASTGSEGKEVVETVEAKHIVLASGARAKWFPGMEPDGDRIVTYRELIVGGERPESIVVLGGGAIGLEFAYFLRALGTNVTIVEALPRLCPGEDPEVSDAVEKQFKKDGVQVITGKRVKSAVRDGKGTLVTLEDGTTFAADMTLLALGVRANVEGLGLEEAGVRVERGFVQIDGSCRTNVPGIYAIGDCAGSPMLAHKASAQAHVCIDRIAGRHVPDVDFDTLPGGIYIQPQVASVGRTEPQLKEQGIRYKVGRFPFAANGKNRGTGHTEGFVKVLIGAERGEILGAHIYGYDATELLADVVMAKSGEVDAETFVHTIHNHPTSGEAVMEAVAVALGVSVHL